MRVGVAPLIEKHRGGIRVEAGANSREVPDHLPPVAPCGKPTRQTARVSKPVHQTVRASPANTANQQNAQAHDRHRPAASPYMATMNNQPGKTADGDQEAGDP